MRTGVFKRRAQGIAATLVALAIAKGLSIIGCTSLPGDCPDRLRCAEPSSSQETSGGSASAGAVDLDSGSGCVPSADGSMMRDGCGVFVRRSGNDGNAGSKAAPVATIARAVELAQKGPMRVYACAETFPETLSLSAKIEIYGGLECGADWVYTGGAKTTLSPTKGVPLILRGTAGGARIFDFAIVAPDGAAPGDSSVAVIASGVKATLTRCSLIAGVGADGAPGSTAPAMPAAGGKAGGPGGVACGAGVVAGGPGASNVCGAMTSSGGAGGAGMHNAGDAGVAGLPGIGQGTGGSGDTGAAMWTCAGSGGDGMDGASGSDGAAGSAGSGLGLISVLGYEGGRGGDGKGGAPGQGGGGGGGRVGTGVCSMGKGGAAGGGGGAGGCGGAAGGGGMAGGASIALLSLQSTLTLASVVLVAGNGGRGGDGGASQVGGVGGGGGVGGTGVNGGCHGGRGGDGGKGGFGGGGAGGHTIGLAYTGAPPSIDDGWISVGVAGMGGASMGNPGSSGVAAKQQKFQ